MTETRQFQAEVSRLLDIVAHSIYSDRKVFLRELVSNASDACDRRRYLAIAEPALGAADGAYRVTLKPDAKAKTLTLTDNGIGMSADDLAHNLGTIAHSGTASFLEQVGADKQRDVSMIGQFGVGFYSSFMVADRVEVISRKAGETTAHRWESDGKGSYTIGPVDDDTPVGTRITLFMKDDATEYLEPGRLRSVVRSYADHIALPIALDADGKEEVLNTASALWTRSKSEITPDQYKEFYHSVAHGYDEPWLTMHWKAEGVLEYTSLLFVPGKKPFDLFDPARKHAVRLYVRRVFVTDDCPDLLPSYLRFLKGVVDSEDLPLNINRETLQANPKIARIRHGLVKRVLGDLARKAADDPESYATFWAEFGAVLKEGLYEDFEQRDALLDLARFRSTASDKLTSLEDYVKRMKLGQKHIYVITGPSVEAVSRSPQLEGFKAKGVEVLLLSDPIDDFWSQSIGKYRSFEFHSATRGGTDLAEIAADDSKPPLPEPPKEVAGLIALLKITLGDAVKDVRASERLTDSAVCLVAAEGDMDMNLERLLKQSNRLETASTRVLEINPRHALIGRLAERLSQKDATPVIQDAAWLLLDQARIVEGEPLPDPVGFARRLASCLERGLAA